MSSPTSASTASAADISKNASRSLGHLALSAAVFFVLGFLVLSILLGVAGLRMMLWGLAFTMCGIVLGFLFGIPRDDTRTVNNNLVEISDWLTKIIVGVGLTELRSMPRHIASLAKFVSDCGGDKICASTAAATLLYFGALGFFHGYLLTRLVLQVLFIETSHTLEGLAKAIAPEMKNLSIAPESKPDEAVAANPQVKELAAAPLDSLTAPEQIATWAKANLTVGQFARAVEGYRLAAEKLPQDARIAVDYGIALYRNNAGVETAFAQLLKARDLLLATPDSSVRRDLYRWLTYVSLYRQQPQGYTDTIKFAEEYVAQPGADPSASLLINLACAHGQKYSAERTTNPEAAADSRTKALNALNEALKLNPGYRDRVEGLLSGAVTEDNDLAGFRGDNDFMALVGPA